MLQALRSSLRARRTVYWRNVQPQSGCSSSSGVRRRFKVQIARFSDSSSANRSTSLKMPSVNEMTKYGHLGEWVVEVGDKVELDQPLVEIETDDVVMDFEAPATGYVAKICVPSGTQKVQTGEVLALLVNNEEDIEEAVRAFEQPVFKGEHETQEPSENDAPTSQTPSGTTSTTSSTNGQTRSYSTLRTSRTLTPAKLTNQNLTLSLFKRRYSSAAQSEQISSSSYTVGFLTRAARHLVMNNKIEISSLSGTGKGGRITKYDVVDQMAANSVVFLDPALDFQLQTSPELATEISQTQQTDHQTTPVSTDTSGRPPRLGRVPRSDPTYAYTEIKHTNMRKVIASRLTQSKTTVPHFYASEKCSIDALLQLRTYFKEKGKRTSLNDFVILAAALALEDVPEANAFWDETSSSVQSAPSIDISVAVATEGGLITPIIKKANQKSILSINETVKDLAIRGREGTLLPEEYSGGSFTISNLGMFGIDSFSAVINPPQACILAVSAGVQNIVIPGDTDDVQDASSHELRHFGEVSATDENSEETTNSNTSVQERAKTTMDGDIRNGVVSTTMDVCLSSDQRVVDQIIVGRFLEAFKRRIETPSLLL